MLRWIQSQESNGGRRDVGTPDADEQKCPGMATALKRVLSKTEQPEVLDLGQFSRSAAVYVAGRGAKVHVEDFVPPSPKPKKKKNGEGELHAVEAQPVVIPHPDQRFDLVLAWEHPDFVPPDRLQEFYAEMTRVLVPGGWLLMYARDDPNRPEAGPGQPACYRLTADDRLTRTMVEGPVRPRWSHPNRAIERALSPMAVQSIHLQRNRMREFLARKPLRPGGTG